jgi:hypothetical protein
MHLLGWRGGMQLGGASKLLRASWKSSSGRRLPQRAAVQSLSLAVLPFTTRVVPISNREGLKADQECRVTGVSVDYFILIKRCGPELGRELGHGGHPSHWEGRLHCRGQYGQVSSHDRVVRPLGGDGYQGGAHLAQYRGVYTVNSGPGHAGSMVALIRPPSGEYFVACGVRE